MDLRLRAVELSDIDRIFEWENDFSLWNLGSTRAPFSRYAIEDYVKSVQNYDIYTTKQIRFMIDIIENNDVITVGCVDLYDLEPDNLRAGVGVLIDTKYRNMGYASMAIDKLWLYSRDILHLNQLFAHIPEDNISSLRLFSKCGFKETAILRQWLRRGDGFIDVKLFQKIK